MISPSSSAFVPAHRMEIREALRTDLSEASPSTTSFSLQRCEVLDERLTLTRLFPSGGRALIEPARLKTDMEEDDDDEDMEEGFPDCTTCHTSLRLGDNGTIASAGYPAPYAGGQRCLWLLQTTDGSRLRLRYMSYAVCSTGFILIHSPAWPNCCDFPRTLDIV